MNKLHEAKEKILLTRMQIDRDNFSWTSRHAISVLFEIVETIVDYLLERHNKPADVVQLRAAE